MPNRNELQALFAQLSAPFSEEAVERTQAAQTRKGYDTTGIKYQYIANRLNEVLGVGGFRIEREFTMREMQSRNGAPRYDVTCDLVMQLGSWEQGQFVPFAEACGTGGHISSTEADAKKGAFTNGLKKVAAMFGCGWQAYAGCIDDDNTPLPDRWDAPRVREQAPRRVTLHRADQAEHVEQTEPVAIGDNGRITQKQLAKLRQLAEEETDWRTFREQVREHHGVNPEYLDRRLASSLIGQLIDARRQEHESTTRLRRTA